MSDAINNAMPLILRPHNRPSPPPLGCKDDAERPLAQLPSRRHAPSERQPLFLWALLVPLVLASVAQAANDGRGFYGATDDKVVTDAGFILIVFFPVFIFCMSMLQRHLDKRKEARKAAHKAQLSNAQWRGGW